MPKQAKEHFDVDLDDEIGRLPLSQKTRNLLRGAGSAGKKRKSVDNSVSHPVLRLQTGSTFEVGLPSALVQ